MQTTIEEHSYICRYFEEKYIYTGYMLYSLKSLLQTSKTNMKTAQQQTLIYQYIII